MSNQVSYFEKCFGASAKGLIPYSSGFKIVGKVGEGRPQTQRSNMPPPSEGIVSITPAVAAVEQAASLVGGGRQQKTKHSRRGVRKKYRKRKKKPKISKKRNSSRVATRRKEAL